MWLPDCCLTQGLHLSLYKTVLVLHKFNLSPCCVAYLFIPITSPELRDSLILSTDFHHSVHLRLWFSTLGRLIKKCGCTDVCIRMWNNGDSFQRLVWQLGLPQGLLLGGHAWITSLSRHPGGIRWLSHLSWPLLMRMSSSSPTSSPWVTELLTQSLRP